jgi:uncharacterized membrane protein AbrB (regulator of aidB expression)
MSTESRFARVCGGTPGRYLVGGFCVAMAAVLVGISLAHHHVGDAIWLGAILLGYAVLIFAFSRRSEAAALLASHEMDERRRRIDEFAAATAARLMAVVLLAGFVVQLARGGETAVWADLCAVFGFVYIGALLWGRRRL